MPFLVITRTLFCLSSNPMSINSSFVTMPYTLIQYLWCIYHMYLYPNSNMQVSFNKIAYIHVSVFCIMLSILTMSLRFFKFECTLHIEYQEFWSS